MPGKRASLRNEKQYAKLKGKGVSKERASRGDKKSGSKPSQKS